MKNVILIILDGLRKDRMSCYGYPNPTTPNIDKFAKDGLMFNKYYTSQNNTLSCFANILTGENSLEHGLVDHEDKDRIIEYRTLMDFYKLEGYQTIVISQLTSRCSWMQRNVDNKKDTQKERGMVLSRDIVKEFNSIEKKKPFFALLHFMDTRHPFMHEYVEKYFEGNADTGLSKQSQEYDNGLRQCDKNIAGILEEYKDDKIIITADHGIHLGERGMVDQHHCLDKHILNLPLFINFAYKGINDDLLSDEDLKSLITHELIMEREYIIAYENTKQQTMAIIDKHEIKKFERMV